MKTAALALAMLVAAIAAGMDLRTRRIPNWLTLPALVAGVALNAVLSGWPGLKLSLLGAGLGLAALLPFFLLRSLGGGDWKLAGALGASLGPVGLWDDLLASILVAGVMALALIVWKGRFRKTVANMGHILASLFTLRLPGPQVSLENPDTLKVP